MLSFGEPDLEFGGEGRTITAFNEVGFPPVVQDLAIGEGRVIAAGDAGLACFESDGELDEDFGSGGRVVFSGVAFKALAMDSSARAHVLATTAAGSTLYRYTDDGVLDPTFGAAGKVIVTTSTNFTPQALAVQTDGAVVVAGTVKTDSGKGARARVYRLRSNGTGDSGFGNSGAIDFSLGLGDSATPVLKDRVVALGVLSGGKVALVGGSVKYAPAHTDTTSGNFIDTVYGGAMFTVVRLNVDGTVDSGYGSAGFTRVIYGTSAFLARNGITGSLPVGGAFLSDGSVVVAGRNNNAVVAKISPTGAVVYKSEAESGTDLDRPTDVVALPDGRAVLVAQSATDSSHGLAFASITPAGEIQNTVFTSDQNSSTADIDAFYSSSPSAGVSEDGELLIGGGSGLGHYIVARFEVGEASDPRPDYFADARANDLATDALGNVHLVYYDAKDSVLKYAHRAPSGVWQSAITLDSKANSGQYVSIALDSRGRPGVAYFDGTSGDLKLAVFDGTKWKYHLVDSKGSVGLYPSILFDNTDRPAMTYYKKTTGDLRFAVLKSNGFGYETVDSAGDVGRSSTMAVNPRTGRFTVAYADSSTNQVKWARQVKGGFWESKVAAATTGGADFLSMAYGNFYEPAISFYDASSADLKLAYFKDGSFSTRTIATSGAQGLYSTVVFPFYYSDPVVYSYNRSQDRVTLFTNLFGAIKATTVISGGGRYLSLVFDSARSFAGYFDQDENVVKVRQVLAEF